MDDFSLSAMSNPALIEKRVLDAYEAYVTKGEEVVVDANNTFMFLVEMYAQLTSHTVAEIINKLNALYRVRATTPTELYMHMSDYDYVDLFSSPSNLTMELVLGKQELIDNAVPIYSNGTELAYRKIVIPENTIFTVGSYVFGLYYPIEIRINNLTKAFSVVYDTSSDDDALNQTNPFISLTVNTVEYAFQSYKDLDIVSLRFPVYQFEKTEYVQDVTSTTGFRHTLSYTNKFYAVRVYRQSSTGSWIEMNQTLSDTIYDPMTPTAKIIVDTENTVCTIVIPQIYFTSGLISSQIKMVMYTTVGAMDLDITNISSEQISASFTGSSADTALGEYSRPLDRAQTIQLYPISTKIVGGSDGYTFEELRQKVINNTLYSGVISKFSKLQSKMNAIGFDVQRYSDGIRNRIFFCSKEITDLSGDIIAPGAIPIHLSSTLIDTVSDGSPIPPNYRWVRYRASDTSFTILPAALLKYDPDTEVSELVEDSDYPELLDTPSERASAYNKYQYVYQPFHLKVCMQDQYPVAYSYDLMSPSVDRIFFRGNNAAYGESINGYTGSIVHNNGGTGGFTLRMAVTLSESLLAAIEDTDTTEVNGSTVYVHDIWIQDIIVYLKYSSSTEATKGCFAILTPTLEKDGDKYLFELSLGTNYFINPEHYIEFDSVNQSLDGTKDTQGQIASNGRVPISSENWTLTFLIKKSKLAAVDPERTISDSEISIYESGAEDAGIGVFAEDDLGTEYLAISEQQITLTFGKYMSQIFNNVEVFTGDKTYKTYPDTVYAANDRDVYLRDTFNPTTLANAGNLLYSSEVGGLNFSILNQAHDWLMNTSELYHAIVDTLTVEEIPLPYSIEMRALNGYVPYTETEEAIAYLPAETTTIITSAYIGRVIWTGVRTVLLTSTNIDQYVDSYYALCSMVTETHLCLNITTTDTGFKVGMAIQEIPKASGESFAGIRKIFSPGMSIFKIDGDETVGWKVYLANKKISQDGVLATAKLNSLVTDFTEVDTEITSDNLTAVKYLEFPIVIGYPYVLHEAGEKVLDAAGLPTQTGTRSFEYYIEAIQLDARAFIGASISTSDLRKSISDLIKTYATVVDTYAPNLLEQTQLYYKPLRSIGNAPFLIGNDVQKSLPLQIATEFTLTVKTFVFEDDALRTFIDEKILSYMEDMLSQSTLSVTAISKRIMTDLSDYVTAVAVSGFNTKEDLSSDLTSDEKYTAFNTQVLREVNEDAKLSIRRVVYVNDRKLLDTKRGLTINYIT